MTPLDTITFPAEHARTVRVIESYGVRVAHRDAEVGNGWDGDTIALWCGQNLRPVDSLLHDLAHWLVCPTSRRWRRDFGLGTGPDGGQHAERRIDEAEAQVEEEHASLLGIVLQRDLRLGDWSKTVADHSWGCLFDPEGQHLERLRWLHTIGLLSEGHAVPAAEIERRARER